MSVQLIGVYDSTSVPQIPLRTAYRTVATKSRLGNLSFSDALVESSVVDNVVMFHVAAIVPLTAYLLIRVLSHHRGIGG